MGKKGTQAYEHGGRRMGFYHPQFKRLFDRRAAEAGGRRKVGDLTDELCAAVNVEPDTIKAWRYGRNAPGDLETVARIAEFFGVEMDTLLTVVEERKMEKLKGARLDAVARVYQGVEDFVYMAISFEPFLHEDEITIRVNDGGPHANYVGWWYEFVDEEKSDVCDFEDHDSLAYAGLNWLSHAVDREWVYLGSHPIYGELAEFVNDTLPKVWPASRPNTADEVDALDELARNPELAIKELREIISKYL